MRICVDRGKGAQDYMRRIVDEARHSSCPPRSFVGVSRGDGSVRLRVGRNFMR